MLAVYLILIAVLIGVDQVIKLLVVNNIAEGSATLQYAFRLKIGDFNILSITHIRNNGAGFSILGGKTVFLLIFTFVLMAALIAYIIIKRKSLHKIELLCISTIIAGGLGNFIDRVRMLIEPNFSGVIDYIKLDFIDFPIFNFADICVCVGAFGYCVYIIVAEIIAKKSKKSESEAAKDE